MLALLVEANGLVRLELSRALEQEHFEILWTTTTQEAVAAYNRRQIDLLLLDLNQPLKVGWDIFEPVGALNPALPIVMVTEKKTELEPTVAERVGTRLEKPFSLPALIQTIHLLLGQAAQMHLQATGSEPISNHSASSRNFAEATRRDRSAEFIPLRRDKPKVQADTVWRMKLKRNKFRVPPRPPTSAALESQARNCKEANI